MKPAEQRQSGGRRRGGPRRDGMVSCLVLASLIVVAYHTVLLYGLRLTPPKAKEEAISKEPECVALLPPTSPHLPKWERNLYQWVALEDPTLLILPDEELGFSRALRHKLSLPAALVPAYKIRFIAAREGIMPTISLAKALPPLSLELKRYWLPAPLTIPKAAPVVPLPRGIFWRFPDGQLLSQHPQIPDQTVADVLAAGPLPKYPTRVEIDRATMKSMTRILVRHSCGNRLLDRLVITALRKAVTEAELQSEAYGQEKSPAYLPPPGGRTTIEVDWTLMPHRLAVRG